jgi:hypothetical protein
MSNVRPQTRIPGALRRESQRCIFAGLALLLEHPDCGAPEASKLFELNSTELSGSPLTQSLLHEATGTGSGRRCASVGSSGHRKRERLCPSLRRRTERESRQFLAAPSAVSAVKTAPNPNTNTRPKSPYAKVQRCCSRAARPSRSRVSLQPVAPLRRLGLTSLSRGQLPGYALQLPLISNVRRHTTPPCLDTSPSFAESAQ